MTIKKFFQIEIHHLSVMIGMGFFVGSVASCITHALATEPTLAHPFELVAAFTGFIAGRFLSEYTTVTDCGSKNKLKDKNETRN